MSRRRRRSRKKAGVGAERHGGARRPKAGYREYMDRCRAVGRQPMGFEDFLVAARRWRAEYEPAREEGNEALAGELEDLLCASCGDRYPVMKTRGIFTSSSLPVLGENEAL